jgi:DNA helicase-2/ATP-dependent DNA helicase PcrA
MNTHLDNLNPQQRKAVEHIDGPIVVLAGAGSGKTRVLTRRIVNLVKNHGVSAREILAVTFTNKATEEMRERLHALLGSEGEELWVATFHSTALKILRRHAALLGYQNDFNIYDDDDSKSVVKGIIKELQIDDKKYSPTFFLQGIDRAKNEFKSPEELAKLKGYEQSLIAQVYDHYQRALLKANAMDFGDLIFNLLRLLREHPRVAEAYQRSFLYILVDEFQDTNLVQYEILKILSARHHNLFVVGDDDQSIYRFRGATIENILHFERDFDEATTVTLEQNYRSTNNILSTAHAIIEKNSARKAKQLWSESPAGKQVVTYLAADEEDEAFFIAKEIQTLKAQGRSFKDIAVFYRTNAQSRSIEDIFIQLGIPYRIFGALRFYDRKEIKDILGFLKLALNESDAQSFSRVINTPPRGIGAQTLVTLNSFAREHGISLVEAARRSVQRNKGLAEFMRLHQSILEAIENSPPSKVVELIIEQSGYREKLKESSDPTSLSRLENLNELISLTRSIELSGTATRETLRSFLDKVSLTSGGELPVHEEKDKQSGPPEFVSLMTLHLCKGLEFPVVFLTGFEEGLLPHHRSLTDQTEVEEERRLCYVGITRAREELFLTRARKRGMFSAGDSGMGLFRDPSRFAFDIPKNLLEQRGPDFLTGGWEMPDFENDFSADVESEGTWTTFSRKPKPKREKSDYSARVVTADSLLDD